VPRGHLSNGSDAAGADVLEKAVEELLPGINGAANPGDLRHQIDILRRDIADSSNLEEQSVEGRTAPLVSATPIFPSSRYVQSPDRTGRKQASPATSLD
jgi:hypothetical protein